VTDNVVEGFENSVPDGGLRIGSGDGAWRATNTACEPSSAEALARNTFWTLHGGGVHPIRLRSAFM